MTETKLNEHQARRVDRAADGAGQHREPRHHTDCWQHRKGAPTDWLKILALYDVLDLVAPGPVVTLSRAVAVSMAALAALRDEGIQVLLLEVNHERIAASGLAPPTDLMGRRAGSEPATEMQALTAKVKRSRPASNAIE